MDKNDVKHEQEKSCLFAALKGKASTGKRNQLTEAKHCRLVEANRPARRDESNVTQQPPLFYSLIFLTRNEMIRC